MKSSRRLWSALQDTLTELDVTLALADAVWQLDPALGTRARGRLIATLAESTMFARLTTTQQRELADLLGRCIAP